MHKQTDFSRIPGKLIRHKFIPHIQSSGVTLIELMIALSLFAFITVISAPYTSSWIDSGRVQNAGDMLDQAYRQAEALALRNPNAATGTTPAAGIRNESGTLLVCTGDPNVAACTAGGANTIWQSSLPDGVTVTVNGSAMTVLRINSFGSPVDSSGDIITSNSYSITRGTQSDTNDLF